MNALQKPSSPSSRPLSAITEEIQFYKAQAGSASWKLASACSRQRSSSRTDSGKPGSKRA